MTICFKWSVVRALNPVEKNSERITNELKEQSERLDWSGLKFPVKLDQIVIFEKFNPQISINVFGFEDKVVYPLRLSKRKSEQRERSESEQTINLLLISDGEKQHYCLIKSFEPAPIKPSFRPQGIKRVLSELFESFSK